MILIGYTDSNSILKFYDPSNKKVGSYSDFSFLEESILTNKSNQIKVSESTVLPKSNKKQDHQLEIISLCVSLKYQIHMNKQVDQQILILWKQAELEQLKSHQSNQTWQLVDKLENCSLVDCKWVYAIN